MPSCQITDIHFQRGSCKQAQFGLRQVELKVATTMVLLLKIMTEFLKFLLACKEEEFCSVLDCLAKLCKCFSRLCSTAVIFSTHRLF